MKLAEAVKCLEHDVALVQFHAPATDARHERATSLKKLGAMHGQLKKSALAPPFLKGFYE